MKIVIYYSFGLWSYFLSTALELAVKHMRKEDEIYFITCESSLYSCESNFHHNLTNCSKCIATLHNGLKQINFSNKNIINLNLNNYRKKFDIPEIFNINELNSFRFEDLEIGKSVSSSLITKFREPEINFDKNSNLIKNMISDYYATYKSAKDILYKINPDIFYLYNGRFFTLKPALDAAKHLNINTKVFELGRETDEYYLTNDSAYNLENTKLEIQNIWKNSNLPYDLKLKQASSWFEEKYNSKDMFSFTKDQSKDKLPKNFDRTKRNIVIFNSSQSERDSMNLWRNNYYKNQNEVIKDLVLNINDDKFHFYLRVHPNLKQLSNSQTREIFNFDFPNLTIIQPEEDVNSYKLMESCEKVISLGSRMGVESTFWNKVSILFGNALYEDLDVNYIAKTLDELLDLIKKDLEPLPKENTYKFGFWEKNRGIKYKYASNFYEEEKLIGKLLDKEIGTDINSFNKKEVLKIIETKQQKNFQNLVSEKKLIDELLNYDFWNDEEINKFSSKISDLNKSIDNYISSKNVKISVCIITKNSELFLDYCLKSVQEIAFEIIILDTGSTDRTKQIAKNYGKVFDYQWDDDFSKARNECLKYVNGDWIMFIDSDEILTLETQKTLIPFLNEQPYKDKPVVFWFKVNNLWPGDKEPKDYFFKQYIFRNGFNIKYEGAVHEYLVSDNNEIIVQKSPFFNVIHFCENLHKENKTGFYINIINKILDKEDLSLYKKAYYFFQLGELYSKIDDCEKSLDLYSQSYEIYSKNIDNIPNNNIFINLLLSIFKLYLFAKKDINKAEFYLNQLMKLEPNFQDALYYQGLYYLNINNIDSAIDSFSKSLNSLSNLSLQNEVSGISSVGKTLVPKIYLELGRSYIIKNDFVRGLQYLKQTNRILPNSSLIYIIYYFAINYDLYNSIHYYLKLNIHLPESVRNDLINSANSHNRDEINSILSDILKSLMLKDIWYSEEKSLIQNRLNELNKN